MLRKIRVGGEGEGTVVLFGESSTRTVFPMGLFISLYFESCFVIRELSRSFCTPVPLTMGFLLNAVLINPSKRTVNILIP